MPCITVEPYKKRAMERKPEGFRNQRAIILPQDICRTLGEDALTSPLYVTDIGYYPQAEGHYRTRPQGASQHILIYCREGEGWYSLGDGLRNKVGRNQFFVIESGTPHTYAASSSDPWSIYWFHFTGTAASLFAPLFNVTGTIDDAPTARHNDRIQLFEEIYRNLEMGYGIENLHYATLCLWHLLGSFRYIPQFRAIRQARTNDPVQAAVNFMKANLHRKLTLEEMAGAVNYSTSHFGVLFTQKTNLTPIDYFNHLKVQRACQLLDFSDLKIKEIAYRLGFDDPYYFSKVFARYMGVSPMTYKNSQKG